MANLDYITRVDPLGGIWIDATGPVYGMVGDGTTNNFAAFQAAINAAELIRGTVYIPAGTYYCGIASAGASLRVDSDNVRIIGDGIGRTILTYSSAGRTGAAGSGALLYVGDSTTNHVADYFTISDLTISDTNTSGSYGGAGPSGLFIYLCDNVRVERVECLNVKGNGGITINGTSPTNKNVYIRDCVVTGTSGGGWVDGDGINIGELTNVFIERNVITGVTRNGIEGGGSTTDMFVRGNSIDMQNHGHAGISTMSGSRTIISHNSVFDWSNTGGSHGIGLANDLTTIPIKDVIISNNILKSSHGGASAAAINFQPMAGTSTSIVGPIEIHNNIIQAFSPMFIWTATKLKIHDNDINLDTASVAAINGSTGGNPAIDAADVIEIYQNYVHGFTFAPAELLAWPDANWKSPRLKVWNNQLGEAIGDSHTGAIDGHTAATVNFGTLANGAQGATQTSTLLGILVGDGVYISADAVLPLGVGFTAVVTATDTVDWTVVNNSGAAQAISTTFRIRKGDTGVGPPGAHTAVPTFIGARVYNNADQAVSHATFTALALNTERYDTDVIHDTATNNSRLTCKTAGKYSITGHVSWEANATGSRMVIIRRNGTQYIAIQAQNAGQNNTQSVATHYELVVNDYVELVAYQDSGVTLNVTYAGDYSPEFDMALM